MDFALAKELKDAGFPQKETFNQLEARVFNTPKPDEPTIPTLSELVEACGEDFDCLFSNFERIDEGYRQPHQWRADATNRTGYSCAGPTPTIAVAGLWLALQTKSPR